MPNIADAFFLMLVAVGIPICHAAIAMGPALRRADETVRRAEAQKAALMRSFYEGAGNA